MTYDEKKSLIEEAVALHVLPLQSRPYDNAAWGAYILTWDTNALSWLQEQVDNATLLWGHPSHDTQVPTK